MIREGAGMPVSRFCVLLGIPRRTYCRMQSRNRAGAAPVKGPWPSPAVDAMEEVLQRYVHRYPQYGHRRIHALVAADGHSASPSTVLRAMQRMRRHPPVVRRAH